ncbi:MAG: PKD domain-containing protein, partial [Candidatus Thermoplasmatota archaeon]|nr:PKD domain-containing protein [Candidatus Thermoplasmatota archaeon]
EITNYLWNFGDGTTGNTSAHTHTYYSNGNYVITLTVTDNDDRIHTSTTQANIIDFTKIETSYYTMNSISSTYNLNLTEKFYGYDTDGDGVVDTFFDPNDKLTSVHNCHVNISGISSFLLSVDDDETPECLWNTFSDEITPVSYFKIQVDDNDIVEDGENEQATMTIIVDKANWIYMEVDDKYPDSSLTIEREDGNVIYSDMIWRKNGKIYVLDDPDTEYHFFFEDIFPELESPIFSPVDGGLINENSTTITISYNVPVKITCAAFESSQIGSNLITTDNKIFTYTPLPYLDDGVYTLEIDAQALHGNDYVSSSTTYIYLAYAEPPQESFIEKNWMWIALGATIAILVTAFFAFKYKLIIIDDFIYIKNKKILPFFRTIIFGPVSVNVDSDNISKAEFYVDGKLKDALTNPPYLWKWNEKAYLKHTLETKIYDKGGNDTSSGEMTFYIFNPFKSR